jgi:hypothetical protein
MKIPGLFLCPTSEEKPWHQLLIQLFGPVIQPFWNCANRCDRIGKIAPEPG